MANVTVTANLGVLKDPKLDLTKEMVQAAGLIAEEMRGNVKKGLGVKDQALKANKPGYAKRKIKLLGHARPLIGENRTLVTPSSYKIKSTGKNKVRISLPGGHPDSNLSVGQIAYIHNFGLGNNPIREFAGVTKTAIKRILAFMADKISRKFK